MTRVPTGLPIEPHLPEVAAKARAAGVLLLAAPPGTGKTTLVPGALLDGGAGGEVVVLEPRRLAAREAARRVAFLRGGAVGDEVGYQVRHDRAVSRATRIRFVTEGVLVRQILEDASLPGVACVVLDEFHERHIEGDLALAMLAEVRATLRPDLQLVVMSATLEVGPLRAFLAPCAVHEVSAAMHPVETVWLGGGAWAGARELAERVRAGVRQALAETAGDVLVFLPGVGEIDSAADALAGPIAGACEVIPLHGQLEGDAQDRALAPGVRRKVILATNIAETSLTIDGVTAVVDSGFARVLRHDPGRGLDTLLVERISRASADQRRGRAGRTAPGRCYRLWSRVEEAGMAAFTAPEVRRIDLAGPALEVRAFAGRSAAQFRWLEAPEPAGLARAEALLVHLGAVDGEGRVTPVGRGMLELPLHPRLARAMVAARALRVERSVAEVAALLAERELGRRRTGAGAELPCDVLEQLELWREAAAARFRPGLCQDLGIDPDAARAVQRAAQQIGRGCRPDRAGDDLEARIRRALLAGFPDRVARRLCPTSTEAVMVGGRGLLLPASVQASDAELLLALRVLETRGARAGVAVTAAVEREWLAGEALVTDEVTTLAEGGRPQTVRRTRYHDLVLAEARVEPDRAAAAGMLAERVRADAWAHLGEAKELRAFLARLRWLRSAAPDVGVPDLDDHAVADAAAEACAGLRSLAELRSADVLALLEARLPPALRARLPELAPARITLPSGRKAAIHYDREQGPMVASRLQDFFGLRDTPRIAHGRVPLCLQLLAPNQRPVQITRDLASFWASVYPKVRSELRRRYPRHSWPEDPIRG